MTAAVATTAAEAQRRLEELHAEQRSLPAAVTAARRNGDIAEYLRIESRREDLLAEVDAAQVDVYQLRLAEAWAEAERCAEAEPAARDALTKARAAADAHQARHPAGDATPEELAAHQAQQIQHGIAVTRAAAAADEASAATGTALAAVDDLEDGLELLAGERPAGGEGLRAVPHPLAVNVALQHPARPIGIGVLSLQAGTIPPRWAAWQLRRNPAAFLDQPGSWPRWDQVNPNTQPTRGLISGPSLGGALDGWTT